MKKILLTIAVTGLLVHPGNISAGAAPPHNADVQEIISIHAQMADLDKLILANPEDLSLKLALEKLETELVGKLRNYNAMRREALEALPAAGPSQKTD